MSAIDSIFAGTFNALTRAMRIPHVTESTPTQRTRVEWAMSGAPKPEATRYQRSGEKTAGRLSWPHTATIYAGSQTEVMSLVGQLWAHVDALLGPKGGDYAIGEPGDADYVAEQPGYEFTPGSLRGILGGDGKAVGYACDVTVVLRQTVPAIIYPAGPPVESIDADVLAASVDGTSTETAAAIAIA